jgi:hypothetical protein
MSQLNFGDRSPTCGGGRLCYLLESTAQIPRGGLGINGQRRETERYGR